MTKKELLKKFREEYNWRDNKKMPAIKKVLKSAEGILLIAGIEGFFERNIDFRNIKK